MNSIKIIKDRDNTSQRRWVFIVRLIGFIVFIIPLIQPMYAYMIIGMEEIQFSRTRIILVILGFAVSSSGKFIGIINNNLGLFVKNALKKFAS
ncbi:hypothetical protein IMCC3317_12890 [Kordia antarctica]|uniref:Uncharacterized protein n=1 Tax=Kordia antarctica TaxID=1218801 RepID=A0A7L4ZHI1_9FLAO|nr:hypothetical protein [Kordia antarctica]QHI35941.1 hypothetical protein IMCC3317_12890 [Kordia antarctica]